MTENHSQRTSDEISAKSAASDYALIISVLVLGSVLYGYRLGVPSFWIDEAFTWFNAAGDWNRWWRQVTRGEDCGGFLFSLIEKLWVPLAGTSEFALRVPAVLFALLAILLAASAMKRLLGTSSSWMLAALMLAHPVLHMYARQARGYSLFVLCGCLVMWAICYHVTRKDRSSWLAHVILAFGCVVSVSTHIFGLFIPAGVLGGYLLEAVRLKHVGAAVKGVIVVTPAFALAAVWMLLMQDRVQQNLDDFWIRESILHQYLALLKSITPLWPVLLGAVVVTVLWQFHKPTTWRSETPVVGYICWSIPLGLAIFLGPLAASLLSRGDHHFVLDRYFLPLFPIVLSWLVILIRRWPLKLQWTAITVVIAASLIGYISINGLHHYRESFPYNLNARQAAQYLRSHKDPDDACFFAPPGRGMTFRYYRCPPTPLPREWTGSSLSEKLRLRQPKPFWFVYCGPLGPEKIKQLEQAGEIELRQQANFGATRIFQVFPQ